MIVNYLRFIWPFHKNNLLLTLASKDSSLKNPERDLFLWAVLLNRQELAKLFWRMGKDHIGNYSGIPNSHSVFTLKVVLLYGYMCNNPPFSLWLNQPQQGRQEFQGLLLVHQYPKV